jgi:hypothetical protein
VRVNQGEESVQDADLCAGSLSLLWDPAKLNGMSLSWKLLCVDDIRLIEFD